MDSEQEWPQQVEEKFLQQEEQREEKYYQHRSHMWPFLLCKFM